MNFKMIRISAGRILATLLLGASLGFSNGMAAEPDRPSTPRSWKFGSEMDILPFVSKGYYGSVFAARDGWKFRVVAAQSGTPSFLVAQGFNDKQTRAVALLADRFFGPRRQHLEGFWLGGGTELWRSRIRCEDHQESAYYNNLLLTAGGGYVYRFSRRLYLNPWAGGHFVVAGRRNIPVSGKSYHQPLFTPEVSVKFGISF